MGTNAKILDCCPEPISLLRRTASQEVVFKVDALTAPHLTTRQQLRWLTKSGQHSHTNGMCVRGW